MAGSVIGGYTKISNKEMYFIMTAADDRKEVMETALEGFRSLTSCLSELKEKGVINGTGA